MKPIAVLDLETDPFEYGKMIYPFAAGFYDGSTFTSYWGDDCLDRMCAWLLSIPNRYVIYAHNGGRFDFFYMLKYIHDQLRIVNSRIIQAKFGEHELRDSYAIMPFALDKYKKTKIDYDTFVRTKRDKHRDDILSYLKDDCVNLYDLCTAFYKEFGDALTIGGASMRELKRFHNFDCGNAIYDERLRSKFYFGGRNQCFQTGIINRPIKVYDVNSMYPYVMHHYLHPVSTGLIRGTKIDNKTAFVTVKGKNFGAFPTREKDGSLNFTQHAGIFHTTIHEFEVAIDTRTFMCDKIIETIGYTRRESFDAFVDHFHHSRVKAKIDNDQIRVLFYKFVLNSAYGKFAQNPENYADWFITKAEARPDDWHECKKSCTDPCRQKWTPSFMCENYIIWERPLVEQNFYNVATGASITGAARAVLLRGIHAAKTPMYCDTDSIICEDLIGAKIDDAELGAWKLECKGSSIAICGKKLYAIFNDQGECIKKAHKGARLTGDEILRIAKGDTVESYNPVPAFKFDGSYRFTKRNIQMTT